MCSLKFESRTTDNCQLVSSSTKTPLMWGTFCLICSIFNIIMCSCEHFLKRWYPHIVYFLTQRRTNCSLKNNSINFLMFPWKYSIAWVIDNTIKGPSITKGWPRPVLPGSLPWHRRGAGAALQAFGANAAGGGAGQRGEGGQGGVQKTGRGAKHPGHNVSSQLAKQLCPVWGLQLANVFYFQYCQKSFICEKR